MFRVKDSIHIRAPLDRCFLLSTSIELVEQTLQLHPVAGKTAGLVIGQDTVTWRGWKFGLPALHTSRITAYQRPFFFQDSMERGMFRRFQHDHHFREMDGMSVLWDVVRFSLPVGPVGRLVGRQVLVPHTMGLLEARFALIKRLAEGDGWRDVLQPEVVTAVDGAPAVGTVPA